MILSNIRVWLKRAERPPTQRGARFANSCACGMRLRKPNKQSIGKFVTMFIEVDSWNNDFIRSGLVERFDECCGCALRIKMAERALSFCASTFAEPETSLLVVLCFQQTANENLMNVTLCCDRLARQLGGRLFVARQGIIFCGCFRIFCGFHLLTVDVKAF